MFRPTLLVFITAATSCVPRTPPPASAPTQSESSEAPAPASGPAPGTLLERGVSLAYTSNGREQLPWLIDSVQRNVAHAGRFGCARIWMRRGGPQAPSELRFVCVSGDTLFSWNNATNAWRADRPVGANMRLAVVQSSGARVVYETSALGERSVGGERVPFVATTIVTMDTAGKAVRRLRESYAVSLVTALDGVFEVPDSSRAGAWKEQQRFELLRIERPMPR